MSRTRLVQSQMAIVLSKHESMSFFEPVSVIYLFLRSKTQWDQKKFSQKFKILLVIIPNNKVMSNLNLIYALMGSIVVYVCHSELFSSNSHDLNAKFKISKTNSSRKSLQCELKSYKYETCIYIIQHQHSNGACIEIVWPKAL